MFFIIAAATSIVFLFCQQGLTQEPAKVVMGQISQIDWASSTIAVRYLQEHGYVVYDEVSLFVPDNANIFKGNDRIGFTDLQIGDQVTAEYINTSPGPLQIINMTVVIP